MRPNKLISKPLSYALREYCAKDMGRKIKSSHAYELVAAYFGYRCHISMLSDDRLRTVNRQTSIEYMTKRLEKLEGIQFGVGDVEQLHTFLSVTLSTPLKS